MGKVACLFPGQGSQSVGMGADLFNQFDEARLAFEKIDNIAQRPLSKLCFEGPDGELKRTVNTQPTILSTSLAAWQVYQSHGGPSPDFVAGHSLGEITALVAASALSFEDAVKLVEKRAHLMEECPRGAMSAVIGVGADDLDTCAKEAQAELLKGGATADEACVVVANLNTREQLVISGNPNAVQRAGELAKGKGGKVIPLPVGGAFHSPLMRDAAKEFSATLETAAVKDAQCYVVQNFDAMPAKSALEIKGKLARQMENPVRWYATIEYMLSQGVDTFIEIGPGKVLTGMVKKIDKTAKTYNINDAQTMRDTLAAVKGSSPALA